MTKNLPGYQGCFWHCIRHDQWCLLSQAFEIYQSYTIWVYQGCFWHCIRHDHQWCLLWKAFEIYQTSLWYLSGYAFEFIKAVSDTILDMINAAYYDKPLIFIGLYVWVYQGCFWHGIWHDKFRLLWQAFDIYQDYTFEFTKAVSNTVLDMVNSAYNAKPLILIFHHQVVNINCWIRSSL